MFDLSNFRTCHIVKKTATAAGALVALAAISLSGVQAAPITIPTGLNPGDTYRLAFVTSDTRDALSSDIADYNAFVTAAANAAPLLAALGTSWTAIASTLTIDARDNTNTNPTSGAGISIYNLDGDLVAVDNFDLWDGSIQSPFLLDENGHGVTNDVWTGTNQSGGADAFGPLGGSLPASMVGISGLSTTNSDWVSGDYLPDVNSLPVYALSGTITVPTEIPEPAALTLFALGLAGLGLARRKRRG